MLAFGLAAAVAFADQRATRMELGLLKTFQAALGISEDEVAQIIDVIEQGGSLSEALGEPLERLYAEVMVLVSAADGQLKEAEARALVESFAADPLFHNVSPERAQGFVSEAVAALADRGPAAAAAGAGPRAHHAHAAAEGLPAGDEDRPRGRARPSHAEQRILDLLQATFGLADDEVSRLDRGSRGLAGRMSVNAPTPARPAFRFALPPSLGERGRASRADKLAAFLQTRPGQAGGGERGAQLRGARQGSARPGARTPPGRRPSCARASRPWACGCWCAGVRRACPRTARRWCAGRARG